MFNIVTISVSVMSPSTHMKMKKSWTLAADLLVQLAGENYQTFHSRPALSRTVGEYLAVTRKLLTEHRILEGTMFYDYLSYMVSILIYEVRQQQYIFEALKAAQIENAIHVQSTYSHLQGWYQRW